ncbi:uncharacterized protein JCM10292_001541 [Rhodotorula paludigena]|uniref:uncharacterized protein n=1 Tax=Rhodotorula paludigena TaxID=86838 RepID=UPI003177F7C7
MSYPYGLAPVLRDASQLSPASPADPPFVQLDRLSKHIPDSDLVKAAAAHVKPLLGDKLWNHSHRAFLFAAYIRQVQFGDWEWDAEALYLACLFHDLGATEENLKSSKTSFEFYSAVLARDFLLGHADGKSRPDLVDSVCEAVVRHTNFVSSMITVTGQLIQLGTLYDNIAQYRSWVHPQTVAEICKAYSRDAWAGCFHDTMKREIELKPWSHTTIFDFSADEKGVTAWDHMLEDELGSLVRKQGQEKQQA